MGVTDRSGAVRKAAAALALIAMVGGGIGVGAFLLTGGGDRQASTATSRPMPPPRMPTARDFTVTVLVTETACDPAGDCAYVYSIEPKYVGMVALPDKELRVSYRVDGGRAPQDGSFTVADDQARFLKDVTLIGPPGATLTATVTDVVEAPVQGPSVSAEPVPPPAQP
ncbi:hypothetical protein ACN27E_19940 [Mycobacterium sp. WMMD1722]|uniref:hypothetical protein n=1 Tax=Mycobacterium sp. WMMD1722 TaxID=3404117 RepID=UPI003BF52EDB